MIHPFSFPYFPFYHNILSVCNTMVNLNVMQDKDHWFTFKMILTNFCNVIYCIKKCFSLLIWIWIFFPQAREQELNKQRVYLIPDSFSRWHQPKIKMKSRLKAVLFFPFGSLVLILILWYLNLLSFTLNSFAPWKTIFYLERFASFVRCIFYCNIDVIFWSRNFFIDVLKCVFVSVFFWCCCFMTFLFSAYVWNIMFEVHIFNSTSVFFSFVSTFIEIIDLLCDFLLFSFRVRSFKVIYIIVCLAVVDVVKLHIIWNYVPNKPMGWKR